MKKNLQKLMALGMLAALLACTACGKKEAEDVQQTEAEEPAAEGTEAQTGTTEEAQVEPEEEEPKQQGVTELSESSQRQISAFIGSAVSDINSSQTGYVNADINYDTLFQEGVNLEMVVNYIHEASPEDLPFQWGTYVDDAVWDTEDWSGKYQVTQEEMRQFFGSGWGIALSENMETKIGQELEGGFFYGVELGENGLGITWDMGLIRTQGGTIEIVGYEDGVYMLEGNFLHGDMTAIAEAEDITPFQCRFTATAVESGDPEIFDGLQITGFQVETN